MADNGSVYWRCTAPTPARNYCAASTKSMSPMSLHPSFKCEVQIGALPVKVCTRAGAMKTGVCVAYVS